ncbi:RNA-binding domain-containing protein [Westerdykella ornata]|uniref:RNA-binding domain-containing protein n=1 Tax=Westerdykella ornata TaxID=318751 RepID=A0A6A6JLF9_WESOR|nr:RNA-binding domain-containing protein [Westerdykella ornata]KAF2277342.1 RNA-binding domain-containing protein [Westerdykella ornata]
MGPRRKRQRLSADGAEAVTATADTEQAPNGSSATNGTPSKEDHKHRRSLFVRSLAPTVTTEDLTEHFSESYPIKHATAVLDSTTKQCKGYGFVTFADAEDAQRAMEELNGSELKGKKIKIEVAQPRHRDVEVDPTGQLKSVSTAAAKAKEEREKQRKEQVPPRLIIRNLPWSIKEPDQLGMLFRSYGKVKAVNLPKSHTGQLKGFGFVLLRGRKNAEKAMQGLNGKEIDGRTIAVDWAVDKDTWQELQKKEQNGEVQDKDGDEQAESSDNGSAAASESEENSEVDEDEDDDDEDDSAEEYDENDEYEDISDSDVGGVDVEDEPPKPSKPQYTLFIRNLPFSVTDESLKEHFTQFGPIRYARIVIDHETEKPRGTGFVCFVNEEDMINCLKGVPRVRLTQKTNEKKDGSSITVTHSVLEDPDADATGRYTIDGRILQITKAVDRNEAARLTAEGAESRFKRDKDKRRLYLLSEGTITPGTPLYEQLPPSERAMREASAKQRQKLIQSNPSLHLSLTRLSVRNIPRSITSKDLKQLARQAVVGFAEDVKNGKRARLSKEELARGGEAMILAEKMRKKQGKGIVKQAKIVYETPEGSKVSEKTGAGRSRGYGFIEYYTHRNALMGLRKLNGYAVDYRVKGELPKGKKAAKEELEDRKKRLIVEFAIENANVVKRRSEREKQTREQPKGKTDEGATAAPGRGKHQKDRLKKRKREEDDAVQDGGSGKAGKRARRGGTKGQKGAESADGASEKKEKDEGKGRVKDEKVALRSRIIQKKRIARRARKAGKA